MKMILLHLLDHDLHKARSAAAMPLWLETPARPEFMPCLVSASRPHKFLTSRRLTKEGKVRSGIFPYDADRIDDVLRDLVLAARDLSVSEGWDNVLPNPASAFDYVRRASGMNTQPHILLVPSKWSDKKLSSWSGGDVSIPEIRGKSSSGSTHPTYRGTCKVQPCSVDFPVFCSRPDFVGMYTQFAGGKSSIVIHNVRNGMAFCPAPKAQKPRA